MWCYSLQLLKVCWNVCNERSFDGFLRMFDKIFFETAFEKSIALFIKLLLAPFECKLVHYSSHSESLKLRGKSSSATFSFEKDEIANFLESLKTHRESNIWGIGTQKVPKVAYKNILFNVNNRPSKIRSLHTYDIPWMF